MSREKKLLKDAEQLNLFPVDSLAKTSASQSSIQPKELKEKDRASGLSSKDLLAKYDRDTQSWKIPQSSQSEDSVKLLEALPKSGMTLSGMLFRLDPLEPRTFAKDGGDWLTPQASDSKRLMMKLSSLKKRYIKHPQGNLAEQYAHKRDSHLNPNFLEWMMGVPNGWSDLNCLETAKSFRLSSGSENKS